MNDIREKGFRDLVVWQASMDLVVDVYQILKSFPEHERYALTAQMRRSAVSIPSNIAEGQGRATRKDFAHFLVIARGSLAELETQILLSVRFRYVEQQQVEALFNRIFAIRKMLNQLISRLQSELPDLHEESAIYGSSPSSFS